jgi:microcystin degradation protein MlrC
VRDAAGRHVPVAASFDLHANAPPVDALDFSSAYRTYPHVDMRQTAERVLAFLAQRVQGLPRPAAAACRLDLLLPSFNMRTDGGEGAAKGAAGAGADAARESGNCGAPMAH